MLRLWTILISDLPLADEGKVFLQLIDLGIAGLWVTVCLFMLRKLYQENRDLYERHLKLEKAYAAKMQRTTELLYRLIHTVTARLPEKKTKTRTSDIVAEATTEDLMGSSSDDSSLPSIPSLPPNLMPSVMPRPMVPEDMSGPVDLREVQKAKGGSRDE